MIFTRQVKPCFFRCLYFNAVLRKRGSIFEEVLNPHHSFFPPFKQKNKCCVDTQGIFVTFINL